MHILPMEHIIHIPPPLFIIVQIVYADRLTSLPVTVDKLLQHNGITLDHIHAPFMQPPGSVGSTGDRRAYFTGVVRLLVDGDGVTRAA